MKNDQKFSSKQIMSTHSTGSFSLLWHTNFLHIFIYLYCKINGMNTLLLWLFCLHIWKWEFFMRCLLNVWNLWIEPIISVISSNIQYRYCRHFYVSNLVLWSWACFYLFFYFWQIMAKNDMIYCYRKLPTTNWAEKWETC